MITLSVYYPSYQWNAQEIGCERTHADTGGSSVGTGRVVDSRNASPINRDQKWLGVGGELYAPISAKGDVQNELLCTEELGHAAARGRV